ncbi:hypothetical protein FBUS_10214 [Fasciolopsis buskii]|uniref:Uncharacterized protein n=1 Tax=Fasciolopsis buskii TaxID=27845 RepID=A0A8E0VLX4_9TREM|nr:hypothetical protein FBUS_10214 [Fasciolopsis buski]
MRAVTYINSNRDFRTYQFSLLAKCGIIRELVDRLEYAVAMIDNMLAQNSGASKKSAPDSKSAAAPVSSADRQATVAGKAAAAKAIARLTKPEN